MLINFNGFQFLRETTIDPDFPGEKLRVYDTPTGKISIDEDDGVAKWTTEGGMTLSQEDPNRRPRLVRR